MSETGVKETIYIRVYKPSLNEDSGRYKLPTVWNNLLESWLQEPGLWISEALAADSSTSEQ